MKKYKLFRDNFLTAVLLLCTILFTSCINSLIDDSETPARNNLNYITLEGIINPKNIENGSRNAYPTIDEIPSSTPYYYKATVKNASENGGTGEGSFSSWADAKYSIKVPYGTWTEIIVELYKESTYENKIFEGTKTIHLVVDENSPSSILEEVFVKPVNDNSVKGNIDLTIYNETTATIYAKMIYTGNSLEFSAPTVAINIPGNSSNKFEISNVTPGSYDVTINFYKNSDCSDVPCYSCLETINVYSNLTTNLWGGNNNTSPHLQEQDDGSIHFVITYGLLKTFARTTFYVGTPTDGTGNGSYLNPFAQLSDAVALCTSSTDYYYRIYLMNDISINSDITINKNITILPLVGSVTITGESTPLKILNVSSGTVTLTNITMENIQIKTINVVSNCSLKNCTINNNGNAISLSINNGSLTLSGECKISGYVSLASGKLIKLDGVVSAPDGDSDGIVATIKTDNTSISDIFDTSEGNVSILGSIDNFNFLPATDGLYSTPARQFVNLNNNTELNDYELFVVRYVADENAITYGLGAAGKLSENGGKGTKLKPYLDVFDAVDSLDGSVDTVANGSTENALEGYKYLIYVAGTVGVNKKELNRNLVLGKTGVKASYYIRGYNADNPYETDTIQRVNDYEYTPQEDLFTITGNGIDVHVDNLCFIDKIHDLIFSGSYGHGFVVKSGTDSNVNSLELNNVDITEHQVAGEGSAIYAKENTKLKLNNVMIDYCKGNGYAIKYEGSENIEISGEIRISNNKDVTETKDANIWFGNSTAKIKITGQLDPDSKIGIGNRIPTLANPKITITEGFSTYKPTNKNPSDIFSSDDNCMVIWDDSTPKEVAFSGVAYGSIKPKIKDDIVLVANGTAFINGQQNTVEIVPKIDGIKIEDDKLSDWKLKLKCFGSEINFDSTSSTTMPYKSGNNKIVFPANTPVEGVTVYAEVKYNGAAYSTEVILTDDNILNLTSAPASGQTVAITNNDGWNKLTEWAINDNSTFDGVNIVLESDISLDNPKTIMYYNYDGTKDNNTHFKGSIDGQGHVITINSLNNDFKGALIYNFNNASGAIENIIIEGDITTSQEYTGIVHTLNGGTIKNCINRCNVNMTGDYYYLAGIMGYAASGSQTNIIDCINEGNLTGNASIGGIVAKSNMGNLKVIRCKNTGNITCLGYSSKYAGGIVGEGFSLFVDCMNSGNITGKYYAGGIAGYFDMRKEPNLADTEYKRGIYNSYNTGNINITEVSGYCGGIAGRIGDEDIYGNPTDQNYAFIENCYNSGIVTSDNNNIGGFIGKVIHDCEQSYIKNNFYLKTDAQTYYGYAGTSIDDTTKVIPFTSFTEIESSMNTWVTDANPSDGYEFSNWTITYKNGEPQLDLNIFIEE